MKILYLDCPMGAAGDMLAAALYEISPHKEEFLAALNQAGLPQVEARVEEGFKCAVKGSRFHVLVQGQEEGAAPPSHEHEHEHQHEHEHEHEHQHQHQHEHEHQHQHQHEHQHEHEHEHEHEHQQHSHASLDEVCGLIQGLRLPQAVRTDAVRVYSLIAQAEAAVHGRPVADVHFHELGRLDAIADICAVAWLLRDLAPQCIVASAVHVGAGLVKCAHGLLPVPAPATARLLSGVPIYGGDIQGELCTPTGAALLKYYVHSFGPLPCLSLEAIGYGLGSKDFPAANCLRALYGHTEQEQGAPPWETVYQLCCNLDDMSPEAVGFCQEMLWQAGALDVYTISLGMKKNRPGLMLCCLGREADLPRLRQTMLRHTSSWGLRQYPCQRFYVDREIKTIDTPAGPLRIKQARPGQGGGKAKAEYEDLAHLARQQGLSLEEAADLIDLPGLLRQARETEKRHD